MFESVRFLTLASVLIFGAQAQAAEAHHVSPAKPVQSAKVKAVVTKSIVRKTTKISKAVVVRAVKKTVAEPVKLGNVQPAKALVSLGVALCSSVVDMSREFGAASPAKNTEMRQCFSDVADFVHVNVQLANRSPSQKDLYAMTMRICSDYSGGDLDRKLACYKEARSLQPYDLTLRSLDMCGLGQKSIANSKKAEVAACVEADLICSAQFPIMKRGLQNRINTIVKLQRSLKPKISIQDATERWGVISTEEITAQNVGDARQCLNQTFSAYSASQKFVGGTKSGEGVASVRESVRLVLQELNATFPEGVSAAPQEAASAMPQEAVTPREENKWDTAR